MPNNDSCDSEIPNHVSNNVFKSESSGIELPQHFLDFGIERISQEKLGISKTIQLETIGGGQRQDLNIQKCSLGTVGRFRKPKTSAVRNKLQSWPSLFVSFVFW